MARRAVTKLGGDSGASRNAVQAAQRGNEGVQREHEHAASERNKRAASGERKAAQVNARVDKARGEKEQSRQFDATMSQRQTETESKAYQQGENRKLASAQSGFQSEGGAQDPALSDREKRLGSEMDKGSKQGKPIQPQGDQAGPPDPGMERLGKQTSQHVGHDGNRYVQSEAGAAKTAHDQGIATSKAASEANKQASNFLNAQANHAKAVASGDKEAKKVVRAGMQLGFDSTTAVFDKAVNGEIEPGSPTWKKLQEDLRDTQNPEARQEMENGEIGPATKAMLRQKVDAEAIKMATATGSLPDGVDLTSPKMMEFAANASQASMMLKPMANGPAFQSIRSLKDKVEMVYKVVGGLMMKGRGGAAGGPTPGAADGGGGQPAAGGGRPPMDEPGESNPTFERQALDEQGNPTGMSAQQDDSPEARKARQRGTGQRSMREDFGDK